jgi:uncharacterized protein (DUF1697 family)
MDVLRRHFEELKFGGVETFIASGNVIFSSPRRDAARLAADIENHLAAALGYPVETFVRTRAEVAAAAALRPFVAADHADPASTIHVGFLAHPLESEQARGLAACRSDTDAFHVEGREYYWLCRRMKSSDSKIWASPQLQALRLPSSTMRNLTTVRKLAALYPPPSEHS